ncbi:hypothetical protein C5615_37045 [Burkholderia cepacia]|uniref:Replication-associated protein ORF2/G2P domain-containing protein n=1 Tax=Burkholderia cepacia TaxID=292 RepID=A0A2S8HZJ6_BURCE|nr:hypothetical protein [Burkholderia cepacia]PQP07994.1 hypothetical protein C5615_37045 [Burkholderia cepacia]HDR9511956.1 hypothetical protein [Burkholderia cepacia]HEM7899689.1 hypothetical protein [Burkholderia cenocepacia]
MHDGSIGDFSAFRREWVVRGRNFGDGQVEITATRFDRYMGAQGLSTLPRAKRGESENTEQNLMDAAKRAKQQVRLRCKAIGADRMITLTYRENMIDKVRLKKDFDALRRRLGRIQDFQYVAVAERQKRGAWHLHVAVKGRQNYRVLRSIWRHIVGEDNGNIDVRNPFREKGLRHKLASYLSKYITKDFAEHALNEKRYWTSRGVEVPTQHPIAHLIFEGAVEAIKTAFEAAGRVGATFDRCQTYWNEELGCFWLSTREA